MISLVDGFLNRITMYRLVLYYLIVLFIAAVFFSLIGILPFHIFGLIFSAFIILVSCWISNFVFAKIFGAVANLESVYITALILMLIITPVSISDGSGILFLIYASLWAMASKFIFALGKKHIFNPAAFGVALSALTIGHVATWWVAGNYALLPIVFFGGLLIVRKLRRFDLVFAFGIVALLITLVTAQGDYTTVLSATLFHSSFFFLAFVMLTEPLTMPPQKINRIIYGAIVGLFFVPSMHIGSLYFTPELALLVGNLFAYIVSPKGRLMLTLIEKVRLGKGLYEFRFAPHQFIDFKSGQYLEWTLPHKGHDSRGNRRYFTIASSPTESNLKLGVKFYKPMSSFKKALMKMNPGEVLTASHLSGDFTLPKEGDRKLAFIAGGIGITPFRSMIQYMIDTQDKRPVTLFYACKSESEIAYKHIFDFAVQKLNLNIVYVVDKKETTATDIYEGFLDNKIIAKEIPDYREYNFYISGPHGMVETFKKTLRAMEVPRSHVKVDYFPGFV